MTDTTLSAGAEMLLARMKTNPEDFKYSGRFYRVVQTLQSPSMTGSWIPASDFDALKAAYEELFVEPEFNEWVYNEIFSPTDRDMAGVANKYTTSLANSMGTTKLQVSNAILQGHSDPRVMSTANSTQGSMYIGSEVLTEKMVTKIKNKLGL